MTQVYDRSMVGLLTAEEFVHWLKVRFPRDEGWTHERIGEHLGISAGFIGMVLSGARAPSKAILEPLGMETVTFYRLKRDPFTGRPWSAETRLDNAH